MNLPQHAALILDYWFGIPEETETYLKARGALWFAGSAAVDWEITEKFGALLGPASTGGFSSWEKEPDSALALLILLDQFSLQVHRNLREGYLLSDLSLPIALRALESGFDLDVHPVKRAFFYLPLEHAEDLGCQKRAVGKFETLVADCQGGFWENWARGSLEYARRHLVVVEKFGRFPHRNRALGRVSTPEEAEFMKAGVPF